ncbi:TPM domain-containing protein [Campylobacter geochelonis]|uniref:Membrane protein n=1 Tax=Campylobacter geochelonis TaxID=1780362 RepID=A0A128EFW6_9BACT|nr:TPM domain-containing protein [Campylobacter geochelonis]CZE47760.1 membrane protein [Campylobacter geochelonis]
MKRYIMGAIFSTLFLFTHINAQSIVLENDSILLDKTISEMQIIGDELYQKTGVALEVAAVKSLNGLTLKEKAEQLSKNLKQPYAFILLAVDEQKVDIFTNGDVEFDKEAVLSPYPSSGSIIPIIVSVKKGSDPYNPALFNGYADVAERIAKSKNIELENAVGNTNRIVLDVIRVFVYGSIVLVILSGLYYKRLRKKNANKQQ